MKNLINNIINRQSAWFWAFIIISVFFLVLLPVMSRDAGTSGDEFFHTKHAKAVYDWYATAGKDSTAVTYTEQNNLPTYGQAIDNISYTLFKWFGNDNEISIRHIVNSICGWIAILFAGLIGWRITKKWHTAVIIIVLMFFSPRFLGHSFNNLKDLPLASAMTMGLYFIIAFFDNLPKIKWQTITMLAVSIGLAIAVRIGGLLLIAFFGLFSVIYFINECIISAKQKHNKKVSSDLKSLLKKIILFGITAVAGGFIIGLLLWPYALVSPIGHIKFVFSEMSHFSTSIRQVFEGQLLWSDMLPWYYTPKFIVISIPVAVITGIIIFPFFGAFNKKNWFYSLITCFSFIFPVFWIIYSNANVYGGWRHAIFTYPPMVVAAGLGFSTLIDFFKHKINEENKKNVTLYSVCYYISIALPFILLVKPAIHIVKNHPYEYVYFNELIGGVDKAFGNYELDYYYHSTREAVEWIIKDVEKKQMNVDSKDKIRVASWHPASVGYFLRNDTARFQNCFSRWYERSNNNWDYAIFVVTGMAPEQIKSEHFPPKNCVHEIKVDSSPICIILKRDDKNDLLGYEYKQQNKFDSATYYLKKAFAHDPYNEVAIINLIEIYLQTGQIDSVKKILDENLDYLKFNESMNFYATHYYLMNKNYDAAIKCCNTMIDNNVKSKSAYVLLANIYLQQNNLPMAEKTLVKMIDIDQLDDQGTQLLISIYKSQKLNEAMAYKKLYKVMAKSLEKRGKKEEATRFIDYAKKIK